MESLALFAPVIGIVALLVVAFAAYCVLWLLGRPPEVGPLKTDKVFGPFIARFTLWVLKPIEHSLLELGCLLSGLGLEVVDSEELLSQRRISYVIEQGCDALEVE